MFCESCFGLVFFPPYLFRLFEGKPALSGRSSVAMNNCWGLESHQDENLFSFIIFSNIVIKISSMQCFSVPVPGGCISNCNLKLNGKSTSQGPCSHARHCANINPLKVTCERRCLANNNLPLPLIKMRRSYSEQAARYLECNDPDRVMSRVNTLTAINTPAWDFFLWL